ncbi:hypothetical protein ACHAQH_009590 [Verticillium albo-atrum]
MGKQWDKYRGQIIRLYKDENKTLDKVMDIMESRWEFKASKRAYRGRFSKWGVGKYNLTKNKEVKASIKKTARYQPESSSSPRPLPLEFVRGIKSNPTLSSSSGNGRQSNLWQDNFAFKQEEVMQPRPSDMRMQMYVLHVSFSLVVPPTTSM